MPVVPPQCTATSRIVTGSEVAISTAPGDAPPGRLWHETRSARPDRESLTVTVELREWFVAGGQVTVGREINALVAPTLFTLAPGEQQTVRPCRPA